MSRSGGESSDSRRGPEGYVKSGAAVAAAVVCLVVGLVAGSIIGRRGLLPSTSSPAAPEASSAAPLPSAAQTTQIKALEDATRRNPGSATAWTQLGDAYFDTNQYMAAIEAYTKSLQIEPRNPDVLTDMGVMYRDIGQPQKAIELFDKAIAADPKHEKSLYNKGVVLMHDLLDTAGARKAWEALQRLHPGYVTTTGQTIEALLKNLQ